MRKGNTLERPNGCPEILFQVMVGCWDLEPEERPDTNRVIEIIGRVNEAEFERTHLTFEGQSIEADPLPDADGGGALAPCPAVPGPAAREPTPPLPEAPPTVSNEVADEGFDAGGATASPPPGPPPLVDARGQAVWRGRVLLKVEMTVLMLLMDFVDHADCFC